MSHMWIYSWCEIKAVSFSFIFARFGRFACFGRSGGFACFGGFISAVSFQPFWVLVHAGEELLRHFSSGRKNESLLFV